MQAEGLDGALPEPIGARGVGAEAPDVHVEKIHRRLAADDPFGEQLARAAAVGDAGGVESRGDEIIAHLGRLAEDEIAVRREALRAVEKRFHARFLQRRHPVDGVRHQRLELVPVFGQQLELEFLRDAVHAPGLGLGLETTHHQAADFLLEIDESVRIAHHRQHRVHAGDAFGDDVEVLRGMQRHVDARHGAECPRPLASAVDQHGAGNGTRGRRDS